MSGNFYRGHGILLKRLKFWDKVYTDELENFKSHGDVGEVWFGEDSGLRVVRWLKSSPLVKLDDSIVDLGCGNGWQLIELAREGFVNLTGLDYSENAIKLAQELALKVDLPVKYARCDILADEDGSSESFAVALDKGTYDAVGLCPDDSKGKKAKYVNRVHSMLRDEGLLILTSCNYTESELLEQFSEKFELVEVIPTPSFKFGGKVGNLITTIVFRKKVT